jgi:hypothetical protein
VNFSIERWEAEGFVEADDEAAAARFWSIEELRNAEGEAFLRFSGREQVVAAIE